MLGTSHAHWPILCTLFGCWIYYCVCVCVCVCPGMMIETMAGKSAALHGLCHDATPFTFSEDNPAIDYFGRLLLKGTCVCGLAI